MTYAAKTAKLFAEKVIDDYIPACRLVKLACKRHLNDLLQSANDDYPFYFDEQAAQDVVEFIELLPHTKGEWAFKRMLIKLEPWQIFGLAVGFGWKCKEDGARRFLEMYWEIPRKNGKSVVAAGVGIYGLCADGEFAAEVYSGATTEKQAWEVFKPAKIMITKTPKLAAAFGVQVNAKTIVIADQGSKFEPIIGDPGDGSSPSLALIDEYHEHKTDSLYSTMRTGMGARKQPILFIITTAGSNIEGPCFEKRAEVVEMLEGNLPNDRLFGYIWGIDEGDDWTDPHVLMKANPNYGISVHSKFLINEQKDAVNNTAKQPAFKTKHLNVWVHARSAYFNFEKWKGCKEVLESADFEMQSCFIGLDLAAKTDLNALIPVFTDTVEGVKHYYIINPKFYVPRDTIVYSDNKRLSTVYSNFERQGYLTVVDGAEMDYRVIFSDILSINEVSPVSQLGVDPHGATCLLHDLDDEGLEAVIVRQNFTDMSDPMKELEAAIKGGRVHHDGNPILSWCIANVTGKFMGGSDDVVRPTKEHKDKKIDGAVGLINAIARAMHHEDDEGGVGIFIL
jgi:phage terminase large subunit-like protein